MGLFFGLRKKFLLWTFFQFLSKFRSFWRFLNFGDFLIFGGHFYYLIYRFFNYFYSEKSKKCQNHQIFEILVKFVEFLLPYIAVNWDIKFSILKKFSLNFIKFTPLKVVVLRNKMLKKVFFRKFFKIFWFPRQSCVKKHKNLSSKIINLF